MDKEVIDGRLGKIVVYKDIPVMPAQGLLSPKDGVMFKGGPILTDWENEPFVRHFTNFTKPIDTKPDYVLPEEVIEGSLAWGGAIHQNYGHFIADVCIPRLPPILSEFPDITFCFIIQSNLKELKPWMKEIFDYFEVKSFIIIRKPVIITKLYAGPQIES